MFSKQRHSREPTQPVNSGAIAAASAIGKATFNNGRTVDHSKLPSYKKVPDEIKRSTSMMGSRRNSLQRGPSISRNNSLRSTSGTNGGNSHILNSGRPKTSLTSSDSGRTQSLESQRRAPSRSNSINRRKRESNGDLQRTFHEFGGLQASGVIHQPSEKPKMVKRYVPSANGLVAIDVPAPDFSTPQGRSSSLRRSASTNGLSVSRSGSLSKKKSMYAAPKTQQKRHSSLTENSFLISSSKLHSASSKTSLSSANPHPLIETYVEEETEQELKLEDLVRPMELSSSNDTQLQAKELLVVEKTNASLAKDEEKEKDAEKEEEEKEEKERQEEKKEEEEEKKEQLGLNVSDMLTDDQEKDKIVPTNSVPQETIKYVQKTKIITEEMPKKEITPVTEDTEDLSLSKSNKETNDLNQDIDDEFIPELKHSGTSDTEFFDSSEVIEPSSILKDSGRQDTEKPSTSQTRSNGGTSLAQHLRAVNPYLNQLENSETQIGTAQITDNEKSVADNSRVNDKNLYKVPSPMKSALKKSSTRSSNTSSVYSEYSPANDAYISLTTAENTRLNAKLAQAETPSYKPRHPGRPQSMVNSVPNRSASPIARDRKQVRRGSIGPQQKGARTSAYKLPNDSNTSIAINAAKVSANGSRTRNAVESTVKPSQNGTEENSAKKKPQLDKNISPLNNSILYPKEPPPKKSSFEKLRTQESSHLGFKKLSLRDESILASGYDQAYRNEFADNDLPTTPSKKKKDFPPSAHDSSRNLLQNSGWKSRIHDSDSEEEAALFSSAGTSRSTQSTSNGNQYESPGTTPGFSLFKNKNKGQRQKNDIDFNLAPPQPGYLESDLMEKKSSSDSANSTPNKINKKWSRMSLRSSSTGDVQRKTSVESPKSNPKEKRFHSHTNVDNGSNVMKSKTLRVSAVAADDGTEAPPKKKNAFSKKLKKLFGRNS